MITGCYSVCVCVCCKARWGNICTYIYWETHRSSLRGQGSVFSGKNGKSEIRGRWLFVPFALLENFWFWFCFAVCLSSTIHVSNVWKIRDSPLGLRFSWRTWDNLGCCFPKACCKAGVAVRCQWALGPREEPAASWPAAPQAASFIFFYEWDNK